MFAHPGPLSTLLYSALCPGGRPPMDLRNRLPYSQASVWVWPVETWQRLRGSEAQRRVRSEDLCSWLPSYQVAVDSGSGQAIQLPSLASGNHSVHFLSGLWVVQFSTVAYVPYALLFSLNPDHTIVCIPFLLNSPPATQSACAIAMHFLQTLTGLPPFCR